MLSPLLNRFFLMERIRQAIYRRCSMASVYAVAAKRPLSFWFYAAVCTGLMTANLQPVDQAPCRSTAALYPQTLELEHHAPRPVCQHGRSLLGQ